MLSAYSVRLHPLGFFQLDPVPDVQTLTRFYQSQYYDLLRQGGRAPELRKLLDFRGERSDELMWLKVTLYQDIADALQPYVTGGGEVLDVGCGVGDLLRFLKESGFSASGIEPSAEAVDTATALGVEAYEATLEQWAAQAKNQGRYSAITLINVLEHVPDPVAVLTTLREMLAPSGVLCFRVPNDFTPLQSAAEAAGIERKKWWVASPDHINYFREDSARAICDYVGLEVLKVTVDFPMEFFLLMGMNYVDDPLAGKQVHALRKAFELNIPKQMRQSLYQCLAGLGMGRNILVTARNT